MKILELKNAITKVKILMNGLDSRAEGTKERIRELKGKTIEITHQNNREKCTGGKNKCAASQTLILKL